MGDAYDLFLSGDNWGWGMESVMGSSEKVGKLGNEFS